MLGFAVSAIAAAMLALAHAAPPRTGLGPSDAVREPAAPAPRPVTTAPNPINQRFQSLDEYLAFREKRAAIDDAWYREVKPGVYQLETGNYRGPPIAKRLFTREELMRKYGFTR